MRHSYFFYSPGHFLWWGDPVLWQVAVLTVAAICGVTLLLPGYSARGGFFVITTIFAPFLFGLVSAVFQIQMTFLTLGVESRSVDRLEIILCQDLSSDLGLFSSVALCLLSAGSKLFQRIAKGG